MDLFEASTVQALLSVLRQDSDYRLRTIFRWYSRTFHTPLHLVDELPLEHVLETYFESTFEDMKPDDLRKYRDYLVKSKEERRHESEEESEDEYFRKVSEQARKEEEQKSKKQDEKKAAEEKVLREILGEDGPTQPAQAPEEKDISIRFESSNLMNEDLDDMPSFNAPVKD